MARNIELKVQLADRDAIETALLALGATREWTREQRDTFYDVPTGWLKLREAENTSPELISYRRATNTDPRPSDYEVRTLDDAAAWHRLLAHVLPLRGVVVKQRTLWLWRHTRIHLDQVERLGDHLELETVLNDIDDEEGFEENAQVIEALGIAAAPRLATPYLELLEQSGNGRAG